MDTMKRNKGFKSTLLIIDAQNGVLHNAYMKDEIVENIGLLISKARASNTPIIWVQHTDNELKKGSAAWMINPKLKQSADEHFIEKSYNSAFEDTPLQDVLEKLEIKKIILAGASTNWCIRSTAYSALEKGYDVCRISDAHTTESIECGENHIIEANDIIQEMNITFKWLKYPNRINECQRAADYKF